MPMFRKRPIVIEARKYLGKIDSDLFQWVNYGLPELANCRGYDNQMGVFVIRTPGGDMTAITGDWIIKGVAGEFHPCKPDIFEATYEAVEP